MEAGRAMREAGISPMDGITPDYDKMAITLPCAGRWGTDATFSVLREGVIDLVQLIGFGRWDGPGEVVYAETTFSRVRDDIMGRLTYVLTPGEWHEKQELGMFLPDHFGIKVCLGCEIEDPVVGGAKEIVVGEVLSVNMVVKGGPYQRFWMTPMGS